MREERPQVFIKCSVIGFQEIVVINHRNSLKAWRKNLEENGMHQQHNFHLRQRIVFFHLTFFNMRLTNGVKEFLLPSMKANIFHISLTVHVFIGQFFYLYRGRSKICSRHCKLFSFHKVFFKILFHRSSITKFLWQRFNSKLVFSQNLEAYLWIVISVRFQVKKKTQTRR